ncbi:UDP-2,3-diacylglucosamine diphosphatase [Bernardetia sp. Wsw4-3y2]|uniref:UDP-2,3-diacylglucosamine diphosphatase n=1 Tax=Bernardetia sp. Wsw4-3y2 TaxID=3127471 RepID=UPI0030D012ED
MKRKVEVVIISDVHLGTYGSKALPLLDYLNSIEPKIVVLNGDIIDGWQFSRKYFPTSHVEVVKKILDWISKGTQLYYITGNHDEMMRKFVGFGVSNAKIVNKVVLQLDGKQAWVFHGDVFDVTMRHSKWIAKMGADGYGFLILLNKAVNSVLKKVGKGKISLSKQIKNSVKSAVKSKNNFETTAAEIAIQNGYDYVICGHIHQPIIKDIEIENEKVCYLNSGDWVENMTALEYNDKKWTLYVHKIDENLTEADLKIVSENPLTNEYLFEQLLKEFE